MRSHQPVQLAAGPCPSGSTDALTDRNEKSGTTFGNAVKPDVHEIDVVLRGPHSSIER